MKNSSICFRKILFFDFIHLHLTTLKIFAFRILLKELCNEIKQQLKVKFETIFISFSTSKTDYDNFYHKRKANIKTRNLNGQVFLIH